MRLLAQQILFLPGKTRVCLQLSEVYAGTDQNQTRNTFDCATFSAHWDSQISNCVTHGRSASGGADRCGAMHFVTISGIGSRISCSAAKAMLGARRRIIDCSSKPFCTDIRPAFLGGIPLSASVPGKSSTRASAGGRRVGFSNVFSSCWRAITPTNTGSVSRLV
jgi:hypothetical protein